MEPLYFTKVTQYGAGQLAAAAANKTTINITQMAVGDGSGSAVAPDDQQTQLVNERYRGELNFLGSYDNDPTLIIAELIIPEDAGGWTMREAGLYDSKGKLFAVANTPPNAKPLPDTGITKTQVVRIVIKLQNSENIQMITDTSLVTATRDYVDAASAKGLAAWDWGDHKLEGYLKTYVDTQYSNGAGLNLNGTQFSIKYGNAAGTAAQGNDSRLSDARDWSASVVGQAEAEKDTHTTPRKWTAQRVAQSAVAAFNRLTTPFTRTLLSRANAALVRNDLELGSAATRNAGVDNGNVIVIGSYSSAGLMSSNPRVLTGIPSVSGFFVAGKTWIWSIAPYSTVLVMMREPSRSSNLVVRTDGASAIHAYTTVGGSTEEIVRVLYDDKNTTVGAGGAILQASPILRLSADTFAVENEREFGFIPAMEKVETGVYKITNTLGLRTSSWYIDAPKDRNNNQLVNIDWTQDVELETSDGVIPLSANAEPVELIIRTYSRKWNAKTGLHENHEPADIPQGREVVLRFNEIEVDEESAKTKLDL